jgi:hypothetical protein
VGRHRPARRLHRREHFERVVLLHMHGSAGEALHLTDDCLSFGEKRHAQRLVRFCIARAPGWSSHDFQPEAAAFELIQNRFAVFSTITNAAHRVPFQNLQGICSYKGRDFLRDLAGKLNCVRRARRRLLSPLALGLRM